MKTTLEKRTETYWHVSKIFYTDTRRSITIEQAFNFLNKVLNELPSRMKVWRKSKMLMDDIICNNREAK